MKNLIDIIIPKPKNWRQVPETDGCTCGADRDRLKCKVHKERIRLRRKKG